MKKTLLLFFALIMSIGLYAETTASEPQGDGSKLNPYQIENLAHLRWLSETSTEWELDKYYVQTADIDAAETASWNGGEGFSPIGSDWNNYFSGTYNGNFYTIENLFINQPNSSYQGLFGLIMVGTIKNLQLKNAIIEGNMFVGAISGYNAYGTISNTSVSGSIKGDNFIGGISGYNNDATIKESFSDANISTTNDIVGGIVGYNNIGTIENCYSFSVIDSPSNSNIGGIIGENSQGTVINNYFAGVLTGNSYNKGGIIGNGSAPDTKSGNFWNDDNMGYLSYNVDCGTGKTTQEMKDKNTFIDSNWEFVGSGLPNEVWDIFEHLNYGYPYLTWQFPEDGEIGIVVPPIFSIKDISFISSSDAEVNLLLSYKGNPAITEIGICYGINELPEKDVDITKKITESISRGEFIIPISDLENNKLYHFRPYVSENGNIHYGDVVHFAIIEGDQEPTGKGSSEEPYLISNFYELLWISNNSESWDKHFVQTADINAIESKFLNDGEGFSPIGERDDENDENNPFTGTYNGNYHKIENLTINRPESSYIGLFGYLKTAIIEKLSLDNATINGKFFIGAIAGNLEEESRIFQTSVTNSNLSGPGFIGGISGMNDNSTIEESFTDVTITSTLDFLDLGGITARNDGGKLINNYSTATIIGTEYAMIGGIVGYNISSYNDVVVNNYFAGTVQSETYLIAGVILGSASTVDIGNFWDSQKSEVYVNGGNAEAKTTAEMQDYNTFLNAEWDLKIKNSNNKVVWNIGNGRNDGYPYLNWQYPNDLALDIPLKPIISLENASLVSETTAEATITVEYVGNSIATEFGVCYGFNENPTVEDSKAISNENISEGEFTISITELEKQKIYYLRAYAINNVDDVAYSDEVFMIGTIEEEMPVGDGTEEAPYQISNFAELLWVSNNSDSWRSHFIQTADIDASLSKALNNGKGFNPIGNWDIAFVGKYNGNYHKIKNLTANRPEEVNQALFGYSYDSTFKNINLENVNIAGLRNVAGLIGRSYDNIISNISVTGVIAGERVGGICGSITYGAITECFTNAIINDNSEWNSGTIGGIIGDSSYETIIENNYSVSTINTLEYTDAGGIIGNASDDIVMRYNYFAGTFNGDSNNKRGIIGSGESPNIDIANFWDSQVSGIEENLGLAEPKTTAEMKDINTFLNADWDFGDDDNAGIWSINADINDGYPYLSWINNESLSVGIDKTHKENSSSSAVYPNPFNDVVNITGSGINRVRIYTTSGIQMLDAKYNNESEITIPTSDFDKGIYLFVIENNGNVETYKLIKR